MLLDNSIILPEAHAIFLSVIIEFSRCVGTYSSAKFELLFQILLSENANSNLIEKEYFKDIEQAKLNVIRKIF